MVRNWAAAILVLTSTACELLVDDGARSVAAPSTSDAGAGGGAPGDASEAQAHEVTGADGAPSGAAPEGSSPGAAGGSAACSTTCEAAPPADWQGPYAIYEGMGSPLPTPPDCARAGAYSTDAYDGTGALHAGPAKCSCDCGPVTGATCGSPVVSFYSDGNCTQSCSPATQVIGSSCTMLNINACGGPHFTLTPGAPSGGCAPQSSTTLPTIEWQTNVRLCGMPSPAPTSGCEAGQICAPSTGLPFESAYCVARMGTWACPSGYPAQRTYFASYVDSRACSACACESPTGIQCTATVSIFGDPSCNGGMMMQMPQSAPAACSGAGLKAAMTTGTSATGGSCAPSGGVATGTVAPATPTTVCCTM
jgi:hypothetical protein